MLKRILMVSLLVLPMTMAVADDDDDTSTITHIEPGDGQQIEVIDKIEDGERTITIITDDGRDREVTVVDVDSLGDRISEMANSIGEWAGEFGESIGRHFDRDWDGDRTQYAKSEFGEAQEFERIKTVEPGGRIFIENISGSVIVTGWDQNKIEVKGRLGEDVERLTFDSSGGDTRIKVVVPKGRKRKIKSELIVHVPHRSSLDIETVSASIEIKRVEARAHRFETISGNINLYKTTGDLDLETVSGNIEIEDATSDIQAESISGRIEIGGDADSISAESVSGRIELYGVKNRVQAESISGRIEVQGKNVEELELETISGRVSFMGNLTDDAEVDVSALSGSVTLDIGRPIEGTYDLRTGSGSINCSFGPEIPQGQRRGPGRSVRFEYGDGGADIRVETFSGSININD